MDLLIPLLALIAPFFIWPIEFLLPYPFIIEEIAKGLLVILILKNVSERRSKIKITALSGFLFSFSESVFYLFNLQIVGGLQIFFTRIFLTSILHITTLLIIMLLTLKDRRLFVPGLLLAMVVHYLFNLYVEKIWFFVVASI